MFTPTRDFRQIDRAPWRNPTILGWIRDLTKGEVTTPDKAKIWWNEEATDEVRIKLRATARGVYAQSAHSLNTRPPPDIKLPS